jgi:hypothetical protein
MPIMKTKSYIRHENIPYLRGLQRFAAEDLAKIQDVSRLEDITAGGYFLGLCDQKSSYKDVSDFGRLRSYGHF